MKLALIGIAALKSVCSVSSKPRAVILKKSSLPSHPLSTLFVNIIGILAPPPP
jgi:hypothetical protein